MTIRLLSEEVASHIAAGEVVERPSSVVKELVENSLDAGAARIEVETREGGKALIRVRDNGVGIPASEVELAFRRHATSKLSSAEDLDRIATLGFRGEALSSIAAVSRTTCTTRSGEETVGTRLHIAAGQVVSRSSTGYPRGTEILVEDLFYNVPARRKFLRTERTERRHIDAFITRYAIAYPNVAFQVRHEERESLRTPGNGDPQEGLIEVYGVDLGSSLLPIAPELTEGQAVRVRGYVGPTSVHRANRGYITLMINGRWVEDLRISYAIIQAYHTLLPTKRYPVAFVMVEMPSEEVDVNVHPAKTEVRFRDGDAIFRAVQRAVRATVVNEAPTTTSWEPATGGPPPATKPSTRSRLAKLQPARQFSLPEAPAGQPASEREGGPVATTTASGGDNGQHLPPLRVVGQVASTFIIAEGPQGLYLIDQHAAHERVLYEQLLGEWATGQVPAQPLLEPQAVALPPAEAAQLEEQLPKLTELGLEVEPFGPNTFLVRTLPAPLGALEPGDLLADIATAEIEDSPIREGLEELTIRKICKRAAVKAGQVLNHEEMEGLIKALEKTRNPRTCPHGRPTILEISVEQLAAQFERR